MPNTPDIDTPMDEMLDLMRHQALRLDQIRVAAVVLVVGMVGIACLLLAALS